MTHDTRTTDEIERDIVDERAQLTDTFNDLQKKFSVDTIVNDIGDMVRDQGGELGQRVSQTVSRNPAAVALVGLGLAWLVIGKDRSQSANRADHGPEHSPARRSGWAGPDPRDSYASSHGGHASDGNPSWSSAPPVSPDRRPNGQGSRNTGDGDASRGVMDRVRNAAGSAGHAMSDTRDKWGESASDLSARLSEGLDDMSDAARARVVSARRAAHEARLSSEAMMNKGARRASNFFEDQPLVVGALAVAAGAAFGAMLPRSKFEDDTMGDIRDRLFAEAEAVFRSERDQAMSAARSAGRAVASEVRSDIEDIGSTLADQVPEGKSPGDVVAEHATDAGRRIVGGATGKSAQKDLTPGKT